ncbi:MAG: hypothetical protein BKP49_08755 [Treponema sp. CETP13]|nr:MAG: hypothetical protein BKP49_08755 [Treponema sp. CETP13]
MKFSFKSNRFVKVISTVFCIAVACIILSYLFVYPLWFFADKKPHAFSITIFVIFILFLAYKVVYKIKAYLTFENPDIIEKKKRIRRLVKGLFFWGILILSFLIIVSLVLNGYRAFSFIPLVLGIVFCGFLQKK